MARRGRAHTVLGLVLSGLGTFSLSIGLARSPVVPDVFGLDGWIVATMEGFIMLLIGILVTIFSFRTAPETASIVPATVAFSSRMTAALPIPSRAPTPTSTAASPRDTRAMDPRRLALFRLDEEIRDLTRRINKAGVLLATGQLSEEGYAHYVEDLKRQRGALEASRVRMELGQEAR